MLPSLTVTSRSNNVNNSMLGIATNQRRARFFSGYIDIDQVILKMKREETGQTVIL